MAAQLPPAADPLGRDPGAHLAFVYRGRAVISQLMLNWPRSSPLAHIAGVA
jgi:hypothetical protein